MRSNPATILLALSSVAFLSLSLAQAQEAPAAEQGGATQAIPSTEQPEEFTLTLGAGIGIAPDYEGSDDYSLMPVPDVHASWRDIIFLDNTTLSVAVVSTPEFKFGPLIGLSDARDHDDNKALKHLGDVDFGVDVGAMAAYTIDGWSASLAFTQEVAGGHGGAQIHAEVGYELPITDEFSIAANVGATWASEDYMESFFGISDHQARRSGYDNFDADPGFKDVSLGIGLDYAFDAHWGVNWNIGYTRLLGDAADSPITDDKGSPDQFVTAVGLRYTF